MTIQVIPLSAANQTFTVQLGLIEYRLRLIYRDADEAGWVMDISDAEDTPIVAGIPLITGANLLAQYGYLEIGGALYMATDADPDAVPTFENLGGAAKLYWVTT